MTTNEIIDRLDSIKWGLVNFEGKLTRLAKKFKERYDIFPTNTVCTLLDLIKENLDSIVKPVKELKSDLKEANK